MDVSGFLPLRIEIAKIMDGEHIVLTLTARLVPWIQHNLTTLNAYRMKYKWEAFLI